MADQGVTTGRPQSLTERDAAFANLLARFAALGLDTQALLARAKLDPDARPEVRGHALWTAAAELWPDAAIGVRVGERLRPEDFALFGRVLGNCATLGEATLTGVRMFGLVVRAFPLSLHVEGAHAVFALPQLATNAMCSETVELVLAGALSLARALTGQELRPTEVRFAHPAPRDLSHQLRFFGVTPRYGAAQSAIGYDSAALALPIRGSDEATRLELVSKAESKVAALQTQGDFAQLVRRVILEELSQSSAPCRKVAARLGLHPKALTRRLHKRGMRYDMLVESVRTELAEQYLARPRTRVSDVALLLGYSDKSAFNRAFKRWNGCSPSEYRSRMRQPLASPTANPS